MNGTQTIPLFIEPQAAALVEEWGLKGELERMLDHARQTITGLRRLNVRFSPAFDTGEERVLIEAVRERRSDTNSEWTWDQFSKWKIAAFLPDAYRHFTLLDTYENNHAR